jgi:hypothetical protein
VAEDRALVRNAADRKQVSRAEKQQRLERERELDVVRAVMATPEGRMFVWWLLGRFKWGQTVFDENPTKMAFQAGVQNAGNLLMAEVTEADDRLLLQMMQESQQRARLRNAVVDASHRQSDDEPTGTGTAITEENPDAQ